MIARLPNASQPYVIGRRGTMFPTPVLLYTGLDIDGYVEQWDLWGVVPRTGFPYGWDVEPD